MMKMIIGCIILSRSQRLDLLIFKMVMMLKGEECMHFIWVLWEGPLRR